MLLSPLVERAIELAAEWHDQTYRKSRWREVPFEIPVAEPLPRVPAMAHVTAVALLVQRDGWDDETVAAAFLHDALEDQNRFGDHLPEDLLTDLVGPGVTARVHAVTEPKYGPDGLPLPWRVRKEAYLRRLEEGPVEGLAVSLADKVHNAWTMRQGVEAGQDIFADGPGRKALSAGPEEQVWFFRAVLDVAEARRDARLDRLWDALRQEVSRFEAALASADAQG